ncbi:hypothetical protein [Sphaerisporangium aureirubrum]|uniref:Lasso RiPP family leader peptide-containing protein n=1 Tax=Sphaerisporangium aureirubrum TaxID=1544736 RepID=A0ABW1NMY9_9ACTN
MEDTIAADEGANTRNDGGMGTATERSQGDHPYEPPRMVGVGRIRTLARGSASSGNADINVQYYW